MDKVIIETPKQWLAAQQLKLTGKVPPLYVSEAVVYQFYRWSYRKARFSGIVIGLAIAVAIAAIVKLMGA
jgi:hypothetical protein